MDFTVPHNSYGTYIHCKETIPKIRNKYSQKRNCTASVIFHIHASVSDLYIPRIGLPILLQENMWTYPGIYKSLTDT
jgi:hypothetical protein